MRALVIDIGGTHVKMLATGQRAPREFPSGPTLTPERMVDGVKTAGVEWAYDAVSIGYPGPVLHVCPVAEPSHLGPGWVGLTIGPRSPVRSRSSTTPRCRRSAATAGAATSTT